MAPNTLPESLPNAAFGAAVGVSERTIAGHRAARRLPLLPDGRLDLWGVLRLGYRAALEAGYGPLAAAPEPPPGCGHLTSPAEWLFVLGARELAYRVPVLAVVFAIEAGATCAQAFRTYRAVKLATVLEVADLLAE